MSQPTRKPTPPSLPGKGKIRMPATKATQDRLEVAFKDWVSNSYMTMTEVVLKHKLSPESLRAYIKVKKVKRPDGRDYSKTSDRQLWIEKGYHKAVKEGWHARQAALWVEKESGRDCGRGDIQYWAMKRDLPYLPEANNMKGKELGQKPLLPPISL